MTETAEADFITERVIRGTIKVGPDEHKTVGDLVTLPRDEVIALRARGMLFDPAGDIERIEHASGPIGHSSRPLWDNGPPTSIERL